MPPLPLLPFVPGIDGGKAREPSPNGSSWHRRLKSRLRSGVSIAAVGSPAGTESPGTIGLFIVDIGGVHHGYGPLGSGSIARRFLIRHRPSWNDLFMPAAFFCRESPVESPLAPK